VEKIGRAKKHDLGLQILDLLFKQKYGMLVSENRVLRKRFVFKRRQ
jgi:hypothetical protein